MTDLTPDGLAAWSLRTASPEGLDELARRAGASSWRDLVTRGERLRVYKHDRCTACQTKVESWQLAARTVYACPKCQRASP